MSTISVIIPAYNAERFIGEAIQSALNQTRSPAEIIVIDDASTDRTVETAQGCGDRVRVLVNPVNRGPGYSRNVGVEHSTGEYIAFLDADDVWLPDHLRIVAGLLDDFPAAGLACTPRLIVDDLAGTEAVGGQIGIEPENALLRILRGHQPVSSQIIVRRELFYQAGTFPVETHMVGGCRVQMEDFAFLLKVSQLTPFVGTNTPTVRYRVHPGQSTRLLSHQTVQGFRYRMECLRDIERSEAFCPVFYNEAADRIVRGWEEWLLRFWSNGCAPDVMRMVAFGLGEDLLRPSSFYYGCRLPKLWMFKWANWGVPGR